MKILLVNDVHLLTELERSFLKRFHCGIIISRNGAEAVEKAKNEKPDVIVLDSSMTASDPFQCCRELKALPGTKQIPILFKTSQDQLHWCIEAGCDGTIEKPVQREAFLKILSRFVRLAEREAERTTVVRKIHCLRENSSPLELYSKDISLSGIFLKSKDPLPPGTRLELDFLLPGRGANRVRASGEVVRCIAHERDSHLIAGMGVRFSGMKAAEKLKINNFLTGRG